MSVEQEQIKTMKLHDEQLRRQFRALLSIPDEFKSWEPIYEEVRQMAGNKPRIYDERTAFERTLPIVESIMPHLERGPITYSELEVIKLKLVQVIETLSNMEFTHAG